MSIVIINFNFLNRNIIIFSESFTKILGKLFPCFKIGDSALGIASTLKYI